MLIGIKKFLFCWILAGSFLLADFVLAEVYTYEEDFNTLNTGLLTGQDSWATFYNVSGEITETGCLSGKCWNNKNGSNDRMGNMIYVGDNEYFSMSFYYKISQAGVALNYGCVDSNLGDGTTWGSKKSIYYSDGNWHKIHLEYDYTKSLYRIASDNGEFGAWTNNSNNGLCDTIYFADTWIGNYDYVKVDDVKVLYTYRDPNQDIIDSFANTFGYDFSASISTVQSQVCFTDEECKIFYTFTDEAIGDNVYLMYDTASSSDTRYAIDSSEVVPAMNNELYVVTPTSSVSTTTSFCLYLNHSNGQQLLCGIKVRYVTHAEFNMMFESYDIDSACDDLTAPTSTDSWLDSFSIDAWSYTIQCSGRKLSYWLWTPKPDAYKELYKSLEGAKNGFPINVYYDVYNELQREASSTPDTINMIGIFSNVELISTSTLKNNQASNTWNIVYETIETIIYALTFIYFAVYIFRSNNQPE